MYVLGVFVTLLSYAPPIFGTLVVGVIDDNHHRVLIAADSKVVWNEGTSRSFITHRCKIGGRANCLFLTAGFAQLERVFDSMAMAKQACGTPSASLKDKVKIFYTTLNPGIAAGLHYIETTAPEAYRKEYVGKEVFNTLFVGMQNKQLQFYVYSIQLGEDGNTASPRLVWANANQSEVPMYLAGTNAEVIEYRRRHPVSKTTDFVKEIKKWFAVEIAAHPELVGPPISLLEIRHDESAGSPDAITSRWLERGACSDADIGR